MDARKREEPDRPPEAPPLRDTMVEIHEVLDEIRDAVLDLVGAVDAITSELQRMRQEK